MSQANRRPTRPLQPTATAATFRWVLLFGVRLPRLSGKTLGDTMVRYLCAAAFLVFVAVPHAAACVCVDRGTDREQIREADIVILGRVVALELRSKEVERETIEYTVATVEVQRRWKGPDRRTIEVSTCGDQAMICTCGVHFDLGGTFIVITENEHQVSSCGLTRLIAPGDDPLVTEIEVALSK